MIVFSATSKSYRANCVPVNWHMFPGMFLHYKPGYKVRLAFNSSEDSVVGIGIILDSRPGSI